VGGDRLSVRQADGGEGQMDTIWRGARAFEFPGTSVSLMMVRSEPESRVIVLPGITEGDSC